ncbi:MAG: CopD family protein [Burkholderiaceae bacterium]
MLYAVLKAFHLLAIVFWVGGMAFAHFSLRPAVLALEPPVRLGLMRAVLGRFFAVVTPAVFIVLLSGVGMMGIFSMRAAQSGASVSMPIGWIVMAVLGLLMMVIYAYVRLALYKRLRSAVLEGKWTLGATALAGIRVWVRANLALGMVVIVVAAMSIY